MADYSRIKGNVRKMLDGGASEAEVDHYLSLEKVTAAQLRGGGEAPRPQARPKPRPAPPKPVTAQSYQPTVLRPRPVPQRAPAGKLPIDPSLLAAFAGRSPSAPTRPLAQSQPTPIADPGIASLFGGNDLPATPILRNDPLSTARRIDTTPIPTTGLSDRIVKGVTQSFQRLGTGSLRVIAAGANAVSQGMGDPITERAQRSQETLDRGLAGATTLEDLKTNPTMKGAGKFALEQMAQSAGDLVTLSTGAGVLPWAVQQAGLIGQERAENNGQMTATLGDVVKASPAAAVSAAAERLGTKYLFGNPGGNLSVRLGKTAVNEGLTEGVQSAAEYVGATAGTNRGFDMSEALQASIDGAIAGGLVGPVQRGLLVEAPQGAMRGARAANDRVSEWREDRAFSPLAEAMAIDRLNPNALSPSASAPAPYQIAPEGRTITAASKEGRRSFVGKVGQTHGGMQERAAPEAQSVPVQTPKPAERPALALSPEEITEPPTAQQQSAAPLPPSPEQTSAAPAKADLVERPKAVEPITKRDEARRVMIPTGGKIDVRMELVNASDIRHAEGRLQNRDRDRAASEAQVMGIVGKFDPEMLGDDNYSDRGAPIVGPDGTIESGNGRVMALNRIFDERPELAKRYRDFIESQGFDTQGVERPILIRRRMTEMDDAALRQFVTGSNSDTKQEMSAPERATQDASDILTDEVMTKYVGGSLATARNGDFVQAFLKAVPEGQRSAFMDGEGNLSTAGIARIENAMLARAFGNGTDAGRRFLSKAMEQTDNQTRTLTGALSEAAPVWGEMVAAMRSGEVDPRYDLTDKVLEAIGMIADAKGDGQSVRNILDSKDMFNELDLVVRKLIEAFHHPGNRRMRSKQKIADMLERYARLAQEQRPTPDMFGDVVMRDPSDILDEVFGEVDQSDMFQQAAEDAAPNAKPGKLPHYLEAVEDAETAPKPADYAPSNGLLYGKRDFSEASMTSRASLFGAIVIEMGHDPDRFNLLPTGRQISLLARFVEDRLGIKVSVGGDTKHRHAIDQMLDMLQNAQNMAHVLGLGRDGISLSGRLGLSLANNAAYLGAFFPAENRIVLPRRSNSFAHEWGHALDYHLIHMLEAEPEAGLSGVTRNKGLPKGREQAVRDAFVALVNTMYFDQTAQALQLMKLERQLAGAKSPTRRSALQGQIDRIQLGNSKSRSDSSQYHQRAKALGQSYWVKPTEMFARAFEAYVSHRVELMGMTTEFIGKGDAAYLDEADQRLAMTFPKGKERDAIFAAFDRLFVDMNDAEIVGKMPELAPAETVADPISNLDKLARIAPQSVAAQQITAVKNWMLQRQKAKEGRAKRPKGGLQRLEDGLSTVTYSMAARVRMISRHWKSPAVMKLHDMLTHREGKGAYVGRTFPEAVSMRMLRSMNRVSNIMRKHGLSDVLTAEQDRMLRDLMITQEVKDAPAQFVKAAAELRRVMDQEFYENEKVGLDLGYVRNGYLPRVLDIPRIEFDSSAFLSKAAEVYEIVFDNEYGDDAAELLSNEEKFGAFRKMLNQLKNNGLDIDLKPVSNLQRKLNNLHKKQQTSDEPDAFADDIAETYEKLVEALGELMEAAKPAFAKMSADHWLSAIRTANAHDFDAQRPSENYLKNRALPKEADKILEDFYIQSPIEAINDYLAQSAKRTEYARYFGAKGEQRTQLFQDIAAEGVSLDDQKALQDIVDIMAGRSKSSIPVSTQSALAVVHAAGTMQLLPRAVISSLAEIVTAGVRTNDVRQSFRALGLQMGGLLRTEGAKGRAELARAMGIIDDNLTAELSEARFGGTFGDATRWDGYVATMFRRTGLTGLTRSQRAHLLGVAQSYFDKLSGDVLDKNEKKKTHAVAALKELGVSDVENFAKQLREMGRLPTVHELDTPYGRDFATAANRMINQTIQNPNQMDRPELANNSFGRLAYGIMSFSYAFYRNILKRQAVLFKETRKRTGVMDATARLTIGFLPAAAMLYISQTIISTLREYLLNPERWEKEEEKGTLAETMLELGVTRTFAFGAVDPFIQAYSGLKYQRDLSNVFVGAGPGYFLQASQAILQRMQKNSPDTNTQEYNSWRAIYQLTAAPALTYGLAALPGGPVLGPLTGMGMMGVTSPQAGTIAGTVMAGGPKGSQTDPETGEVIGPPKRKQKTKQKNSYAPY